MKAKTKYIRKGQICKIVMDEVATADENRVHNLFFPIKRVEVGSIVERGYDNHLGGYDILNKIRDYIYFDIKYTKKDKYY